MLKEDNKLLERNKLEDPKRIKRLEDYDLTEVNDSSFHMVVKTRRGEEEFTNVKIHREHPKSINLLVVIRTRSNGKPIYRSFGTKTKVPVFERHIISKIGVQ